MNTLQLLQNQKKPPNGYQPTAMMPPRFPQELFHGNPAANIFPYTSGAQNTNPTPPNYFANRMGIPPYLIQSMGQFPGTLLPNPNMGMQVPHEHLNMHQLHHQQGMNPNNISIDPNQQSQPIRRMVSVKSQESLSKTNSKNTYINKINHLMSESKIDSSALTQKLNMNTNEISTILKVPPANLAQSMGGMSGIQMKKTKSCETFATTPVPVNNPYVQQERKMQKVVKNREAARNSRKRKKLYIELLESKVHSLSASLSSVRSNKARRNSMILKPCFQHSIPIFFAYARKLPYSTIS